jgi:hypothetical protein
MNSGRNEPAMTMQRARALLDAYGSAPDRWPAAERDGARAFIAAEPEARQHAEQARRLDMILDGTETIAPSAGLYARVLAAFDSVAAKPSVRRTLKRIANVVWPEAPLWQPMAALAISLAAGILLGTVSPLGGASQLQATGSDMTVAMDAAPDTDDGI